MSLIKDKYELSLWEDVIVDATSITPEHYEEFKLGVIGSDTLTTASRAVEPQLVTNVNGTHKLTFKMYYRYIDTETGEEVVNPWIALLVNERKVKVHWKDEWIDLIIKDIQENSDGSVFTYTCQDLFINELSKTGFNLEFSNELENNQGTVTELAEKVVEDTDWQIGDSEIIQQKLEEPVYEITTTAAISITKDKTITIPAGVKVLVPYSVKANKPAFCQVFYTNGEYKTDGTSQIVINADCLGFDATYSTGDDPLNIFQNGTVVFSIPKLAQISRQYRGERLVRSQKMKYDSVLQKNVYLFTDTTSTESEATIRGYQAREFNEANFVTNLIANSSNFSNVSGWNTESTYVPIFEVKPTWQNYVEAKQSGASIADYHSTSYLHLYKNVIYTNSGIKDNSSYLPDGFIAGERYVFRIKAYNSVTDNDTRTPATNSNISYVRVLKNETRYFNFTYKRTANGWLEYEATCEKSITRQEINSSHIALNIAVASSDIWVEDVELFKYNDGYIWISEPTGDPSAKGYYKVDKDTGDFTPATETTVQPDTTYYEYRRINPKEVNSEQLMHLYWYFYVSSDGILDKEDIDYLLISESIPLYYTPQYEEDYTKIRSIEGKNSNRFNFIQSLGETFECWPIFYIEHNEETGRTIYDAETGTPNKFIYFKEKTGEEIGYGFVYGIDLKTITRQIKSDQIVSKIIVPQNNNEFATNGFCTIARSPENYSKDTFILNFDYYINQGMLSSGKVLDDLYMPPNGYYYNLRKINDDYDKVAETYKNIQNELIKQNANCTLYDTNVTSTTNELNNIKNKLIFQAGLKTWNDSQISEYGKKNYDNTDFQANLNTYYRLTNNLNTYQKQYAIVEQSVKSLTDISGGLEKQLKSIKEQKQKIDKEFYLKYSRFLQEGSWTSEEYIDDTLYYYDAQSVLYTSSRPQISYNINVLRLSALEEYKNKVFHVGDISYIQDVKFFGYQADKVTPIKEKVIIAEETSYFDSPEKDTFKIQNYKTQFEDLFQRITAATQSLQYASGEYARAAAAMTEAGTIKPETLANSIIASENLIMSAVNQSVVSDNTGITILDLSNPADKLKLVAGGVMLYTGGEWRAAITAGGISANNITSGQLLTNVITIQDGNAETFRWDQSGINAYALSHTTSGYALPNTFVRFDRYGVYGIKQESTESTDTSFNPNNYEAAGYASPEKYIWDKAKFGMTWDGFFVKNKYNHYNLEVSSTDDIRLVKDNNEIIKIGVLNKDSSGNPTKFGIRIKNDSNNTVLETGTDGNLWLENILKVGQGTSQVQIGYNPSTAAADLHNSAHEVIHAGINGSNNEFIVYEDGYLKAAGGTFTGTIYATGGKIGNMTIAAVEEATYKVEIESSNGTTFKNNQGTTILTAKLLQGSTIITSGVSYKWYKNGSELIGETNNTLEVKASDLINNISQFRCDVTI